MSAELVAALERCRAAEKEQALRYRSLAVQAEAGGDAALGERLQGLHADEQHHLSRLTARLVELGVHPADLSGLRVAPPALEGWEAPAREREHEEAARYEALLAARPDTETEALVRGILEVERHHAAELGGKWTVA